MHIIHTYIYIYACTYTCVRVCGHLPERYTCSEATGIASELGAAVMKHRPR